MNPATPIKKPTSSIPTSSIPRISSGIPTGIPTGVRRSTTAELKPSQIQQLQSNDSNESKLHPPSASSIPQSKSTTKISADHSKDLKTPSLMLSNAPKVPSKVDINRSSITTSNETNNSNLKMPQPVQHPPPVVFSLSTPNESMSSADLNSNDSRLTKENDAFKVKIKDLEEKLETLKIKRAEDRDKLREYEKSKLQIQTLQEFKTKAQQEISDLNKELVQAKQDSKIHKDQYDVYKEEMANHEQRIEEITVDKELAEAKIEEQTEEMLKLNDKIEELQLELDVLKGEIEINGVGGAASSFQLKQSEKEQERLKGALIKLRDLNLQDKAELATSRKLNEESLIKIKNLSKEVETLKEEKSTNLNEIIELKDQVTATLGSVQMIENLTENNLDLEAKVISLKETIAELEALNEINDQLQENSRDEEKELRKNLDVAECRIRDFEREIEQLKYNIADHEKTIIKYRGLVKQQQTETEELNRKFQSKLELEKNNSNTQQTTNNFDFKSKLIETKNYAKIIESEFSKIEISSFKKYVNYLLSYMNEQFLKRGSDHECILTVLLFKRIANKSEFILKEIKEKFPIEERITKDDVTKSQKAEQLSFSCEISMLLSFMQLLASRFDKALNYSSIATYQNIGSMFMELNIHEKTLDAIAELLQKDQLDEHINLDTLDKSCLQLNTIYKNHLNEENFDHSVFINDLTKYGGFTCDLISIEVQRLQLLAQVKDNDASEILTLFKEIFNSNEEIKTLLKKINRLLPNDENKIIILAKDVIDLIDSCIKNLYRLGRSLHEICNEANAAGIFLSDTNEGLPSKKLEEFAYQACDKVYLKDDGGPYENLRSSLTEVQNTLNNLVKGLENGDYEKVLNPNEVKINSAVVMASDNFKNTLIEAESIKYKLEAKEEELKELKKHLKFKSDELSENKVRLSFMEKKYENAQKEGEENAAKLQKVLDELKEATAKIEKEHTQVLEALQQEIESLQSEKNELKDKLRQFTKTKLFENIIRREPLRSPTGGDQIRTPNLTDSPALVDEINKMRSVIKLLEAKIYELEAEKMKHLAQNLPELPYVKKPTGLISQTGFTNIGSENEKIADVYKQSNDLLKDFYSSIVNIRVPEIKKENFLHKSSTFDVNLQTKIQMNHLSKKANDIQHQISELRSKLSPGSHVKTALNIFQTPEFARTLDSTNSTLIAEISLPCASGKGKTVDLHLSEDEIKDVFKSFHIIKAA